MECAFNSIRELFPFNSRVMTYTHKINHVLIEGEQKVRSCPPRIFIYWHRTTTIEDYFMFTACNWLRRWRQRRASFKYIIDDENRGEEIIIYVMPTTSIYPACLSSLLLSSTTIETTWKGVNFLHIHIFFLINFFSIFLSNTRELDNLCGATFLASIISFENCN